MTVMPESRDQWRTAIETLLQYAIQQGPAWQYEADFFAALLALDKNQVPMLTPDHPYSAAIQRILESIARERNAG